MVKYKGKYFTFKEGNLMKCYIMMGSPRKEGNTVKLVETFIDEMEKNGVECEMDWLYDLNIKGCVACRTCQKDFESTNCAIDDDMQKLFPKVDACDILIFATPIYSWYCTAPLKAAMDRMVYAFNKVYTSKPGPRLWAGKKLGTIASSGYPPEKAVRLWDEGLKLYAKHSELDYVGAVCERQKSYSEPFMNEEKEEHMRQFAREILSK